MVSSVATTTPSMELTEQRLKTASGQFDLSSVSSIDLSSQRLQRLDGIERCTSLAELVANDNQLRSVDALSQLPKLRVLKAQHNKIRSLAGLESCDGLQIVHLEDNCLETVDSLRPLARIPLLKNLYVSGNPLCAQEGHEAEVCRLLPQLRCLNGEPVDALQAFLGTEGPTTTDWLARVPPTKPWSTQYSFKFDVPPSKLPAASKEVKEVLRDCQRTVKTADTLLGRP